MTRNGVLVDGASQRARPTPRPARRPAPQSSWRHDLVGWSFAAPFVLIFGVFLALPILASLALSFTDFGLADLRNPLGTNFVGLANYLALLSDPKFLQAAFNTAYFVVVGVTLTLVCGLGAALALNQPVVKLKTFFRVGYYLPVVTSIVAIAVAWRYLLDPDQGLINLLLSKIGIEGPRWLADPALAMPAIILMAVWRNLGFSMVIFLAGLQGIPAEYYEAAAIDGAGRWETFRYVTLPLLRPTLLFSLVTTSIGYLQLFEEPFVMTAGGPLNKTLSMAMYLYQQGFNFFHQGYAAAIAYMLFLAIVVLAFVQFRFLRSET
jgi:multiple sugar transport system permease protein